MIRAFYLIPIYFSLLMGGASLFAQRTCATIEVMQSNIENDESIFQRMQDIEKHTRNYSLNNTFRSNGIITIPVVVHVLYSNSTENISDAQVFSQIESLNEDFRRMNSNQNNFWPQADDMEIEFCLATIDPKGDPTCGIVRKSTWQQSFMKYGDPVKFSTSGGSNAWPYEEYLNIWVCDLEGLLGYAQFPGGGPAETDGVVINYIAFGTTGTATYPYHLGRTTTHEVGHWLNLKHIWGDGDCSIDDLVDDTPPADSPNYGCSGRRSSCGEPEMYENYMDYSNDSCMRLFTSGQKNRMRAIFGSGGFRESILTSRGCYTGPPCTPVSFTIQFDDHPDQCTWELINAEGRVVYEGGSYESIKYSNTLLTFDLCIEDGEYEFFIFDNNGDGGTGVTIESMGGSVSINISGDTYTSNKTSKFTISERTYIFNGPSLYWTQGSSWNKGSPPSPCFQGDILINADCIINSGNPLQLNTKIRIANGATLMSH